MVPAQNYLRSRWPLRQGMTIMANAKSLADIVTHHDAELQQLGSRIGAVETTLVAHGTVLQEIRDVVVKQGARPSFDPRNTIGIVKDIGLVFAMVCAGILYLAAQNGSKDLALLQERESQASKRIERMESLVLPQSWAGVATKE
jgi:hypothetical protein